MHNNIHSSANEAGWYHSNVYLPQRCVLRGQHVACRQISAPRRCTGAVQQIVVEIVLQFEWCHRVMVGFYS